jgi:hypothetical protein
MYYEYPKVSSPNSYNPVNLAQTLLNLQIIATPVLLVEIRIWTCINIILKIYINIICGKWYFGVKYVLFSENHVKLEMKKSVIGGRIILI